MADSPINPKVTVAGIGASAGGIAALQEFFAAVPADLGVAYVVVVHLAPQHESELANILARKTAMPVHEVKDSERLPLEADHVYVISPDRKLEMTDTAIGASPFDEPHDRRAAIDVFFRSLAASHGDGFAIILSGGGSDGALGAKAVKEAGGLILVQDPREAPHEGMPRAVIAAELADVVLPVRELAMRLGQLLRNKQHLVRSMQLDGQTFRLDEDDEPTLRRIFEMVRVRTGHDFSKYKRTTILRRLARRMQLNHQTTFGRYLAFLRENPEEIRLLFDDLLISVTTFFRDPDAWEALRQTVIVPLIERADGSESIRIWVPGCATGEEAYTMAILFREEIARRGAHLELIIFASDVDEGALATGREGCYPAAIRADVPEAYLTRYFRAEGDHYRVTNELRDCIVFAMHSVLRDPPFSHLHLISCRNLLIYLERDLQQQLQSVFRYACRDDGYLFIGVSETADSELFEPLDKQHRIFRARHRAAAIHPRLAQAAITPAMRAEGDSGAVRTPAVRRPPIELHLEALEYLAPPSLLVDERREVMHLSDSAGRFLQPRGGTPTHVVTDLVRPELRDEVRTALNHAFEMRSAYLSPFLRVRIDDAARLVALLAQPRPRSDDGSLRALLVFLEAADVGGDEPPSEREASDAEVLRLREKLRQTEERLESMRQDYASAFEDLRAANEELQSLNEEYRSTTEELETSKEELQSVNEELQTVNHELKMKLEEVSRSNNDLENFMAATDIAMLFLDRGLCIKRWTPRLADIFNVKPHDHGRPIGDLTHGLVYDGLEREARQVLADLVPIERRVATHAGGAMTVRIRPYRTAEDRIDGVVLTFVD